MRAMISALVLAGGASRRMGSPKALLPFGESTFLRHIVGTLSVAGISDVVVVLGADASRIRQTMSWFGGAVVEHTKWEQGQLSSIHAGLDRLTGHGGDGAIIWPVDHPDVGPDVITEMVRAFETSGKGIVVPVFDGRRGHPVLYSSAIFPRLRSASLFRGAREVIRSHPEEICEIVTPDPGVLRNIDTPEAFTLLMGMRHERV